MRFSFKLDGTPAAELPYTAKETVDGESLITEYLFEGGLKVTNIARKYGKHGAYEWVNYLENTSDTDTGILTELYDCDVLLPFAHEDLVRPKAWHPPVDEATKIYAPNGSIWSEKEFYCDVDELIGNRRVHRIFPTETQRFAASGGRSSEERAPFFNIHKSGSGCIFAVGWTGQWQAQITREVDALRLVSGVEGVEFYLKPHEEFRTSSVVILPYEGDFITSQNKWRRLVKEHFSHIGAPGRDEHGPLCASIWGGMETSAVLERIAKIEEEKIPFDYIWMDAGWYGEDTLPTPDEFEGDWGQHTGDWRVSPHIHTNGLRDVADAAHRAGMKFLLWFEPERVIQGTPTTLSHPEYFIDAYGNGTLLLNLGNEEAWQYCYDTLTECIERIGIDCYRQDFNMPPLGYWHKNDGEHRRGITEIKHITGLYRLWDALLARFPHLLIDNCSSGGRRIDIELMRRSIPLWRSDFQCPANYDVEGAQIHNQTFNTWMPYSGTGSGRECDPYRIRSAYGASMTVGYFYSQRDAYAETPEKAEFIRKYTNEYLRVRPYFSEDFYPLTQVSTARDTWCASQFDRPEEGDGVLLLFRREKSPHETAVFSLFAIDRNAVYELTDADGGAERVRGEVLADSLPITLGKREAKILFYRKISD